MIRNQDWISTKQKWIAVTHASKCQTEHTSLFRPLPFSCGSWSEIVWRQIKLKPANGILDRWSNYPRWNPRWRRPDWLASDQKPTYNSGHIHIGPPMAMYYLTGNGTINMLNRIDVVSNPNPAMNSLLNRMKDQNGCGCKRNPNPTINSLHNC